MHGEYIQYHSTAHTYPVNVFNQFPASCKNRNPIAVISQYQPRCTNKCLVCPAPNILVFLRTLVEPISTWMADSRWLVHSDSSSGTIFTIFFLLRRLPPVCWVAVMHNVWDLLFWRKWRDFTHDSLVRIEFLPPLVPETFTRLSLNRIVRLPGLALPRWTVRYYLSAQSYILCAIRIFWGERTRAYTIVSLFSL